MNNREIYATEILNSMTLMQKIGQLFVLAFPGKNPEVVYPILDSYGLGGCYISQDNAETFDEAIHLTQALQERGTVRGTHSDLPLILGVDQEGAWGVLVPESTTGPGNLALGITDDTTGTHTMYSIFAQEMKAAGYNTILGPCSDINLDPDNPIIGTRSFGENAERVAKHVAVAIKAIHSLGILATAKHFPGHGDTHSDTHRVQPVVDKPKSVLTSQELLPFQVAIHTDVDFIMTSHIYFPHLDRENPATLSKAILTDVLRKEMGYQGLVITDSMNMGAMRKYMSPDEATVRAFLAGADLIMLSEEHYDHNERYLDAQMASMESLLHAVEDGTIPLALVNSRVLRILMKKIAIMEQEFSGRGGMVLKDMRAEHSKVEQDVAFRSVKTLRDNNNILPVDGKKSIAVINATPDTSYANLVNVRGIGPNQAIPAFDSFVHRFALSYPVVRVFSHEEVAGNISRTLSQYEVLIAVTEDYPLPGEDFDKQAQQRLIAELITLYNSKLVVVGLRSPYELDGYTGLDCYVCAYSSRTCSAEAAATYFASSEPRS